MKKLLLLLLFLPLVSCQDKTSNKRAITNDHYRAIADLTKAIELDPDSANAYHNRGVLKATINDHYGAIEDYTKAIELDPDYTEAYTNRGASRTALVIDLEGALADHNKAIELDPDFALAYHNRGLEKKRLGDLTGACLDWEKAEELGFKNGVIKTNC